MKLRHQLLSLLLAVLALCSVLPICVLADGFSDVAKDAWYAESVNLAYEMGLMKGLSETTFDPDGSVTLAQAVTMACRVFSQNAQDGETFASQDGAWYQVYVDYALQNGILNAEDFADYDRPAARGEMAYLFANALPEDQLPAINQVEVLPDVTETDRYGPEIFRLYRAGVLTGNDAAGTFAPDSGITRAQAAAIITRMLDAGLRKALTLTASAPADETDQVSSLERSPAWVSQLDQAQEADQLFIVAATGQTTASVSLHEKGADGQWHQILSTSGCIGKNGLGKTQEGDGKTPVGTFSFNAAFGIAADPGCALPYQQVTEDDYWSGDQREGYGYNQMVRRSELPDLDTAASEHIIEYTLYYQYCLNISYNAEGTAGLGSAIFLHCLNPEKPYTGGCVAIPQDQMIAVMQQVRPDCVVVIDSLEALSAGD